MSTVRYFHRTTLGVPCLENNEQGDKKLKTDTHETDSLLVALSIHAWFCFKLSDSDKFDAVVSLACFTLDLYFSLVVGMLAQS